MENDPMTLFPICIFPISWVFIFQMWGGHCVMLRGRWDGTNWLEDWTSNTWLPGARLWLWLWLRGSLARTVKHLELITHHNSISILPGRNWNNKSMKKSTTPQVDNIPQAPGCSLVKTKLYNKTEIKSFSKELNNPGNILEQIQFQINFILLLLWVFSSADASPVIIVYIPFLKAFPCFTKTKTIW